MIAVGEAHGETMVASGLGDLVIVSAHPPVTTAAATLAPNSSTNLEFMDASIAILPTILRIAPNPTDAA